MPPNVISGPVEGCRLIQTEPASSHGGIVVACKHCDHARQEYPIGDLGLPERGQLCCWRRFQDHGVAGQDGRDDRPCAEQNRIVPGRDCADDADGAPLGAYMLRVRIAMDRRYEIEIGKAVDEEAGATDPGLRFGRWLALFPRQKVCKHIGISGQGIGDPLTAGGPRFHDLVAPACFTDIPLDGAGGYRRRWPGHDCENAAPVRASAPETIVSMDHWLVINHDQTGSFRRGNHGSRSPAVGPGRPPASPVDQSPLSQQQRPLCAHACCQGRWHRPFAQLCSRLRTARRAHSQPASRLERAYRTRVSGLVSARTAKAACEIADRLPCGRLSGLGRRSAGLTSRMVGDCHSYGIVRRERCGTRLSPGAAHGLAMPGPVGKRTRSRSSARRGDRCEFVIEGPDRRPSAQLSCRAHRPRSGQPISSILSRRETFGSSDFDGCKIAPMSLSNRK